MSLNTALPSSKRAKNIVALCRNSVPEICGSLPSPIESPIPASPACSTYSWWSEIFEAADLSVRRHCTSNPSSALAKRKLFSDEDANYIRPESSEIQLIGKLAVSDSNHLSCSGNKEELIGTEDATTPMLETVSEMHSEDCGDSETSVDNVVDNQESAAFPRTIDSSDRDLTPQKPSVAISGLLEYNEQLYPSQMKIHLAKQALNAGVEHRTSTGKLRSGRFVKPSCRENCKKCSSPKVSEEERDTVHKAFWALRKHEDQWLFIAESIKCSNPIRKFAVPGSKGEKNLIRHYHLTVDGKPRKVCKTMFMNTLCICDSWVNSALAHWHDNEMKPDLRGKHSNRSKRLLS